MPCGFRQIIHICRKPAIITTSHILQQKMKKLLLILLIGVVGLSASAQGLRDVKINEILVKNIDSYADDHANKVGWIEIYNSGYSQVNIAGAYLRFVQGTDTIVYRIPKNDTRTQMAPQGYLVFFCDGSSNKGTFHTNFKLDQTDSTKLEALVGINDKIELLDQSGRTVVDAIEYDVNVQVPDVSYGRIRNEDNEIIIDNLSHITPLQDNNTIERKPKDEVFREQDPAGLAMAMTAMLVVFVALVALYVIFKNLGLFMQRGAKKKASEAVAHTAKVSGKTAASTSPDEDIDGETIAAIAVALRRYEDDLHDIESTVLTINKVAKVYSPWNSKIYSMRQLPNKK